MPLAIGKKIQKPERVDLVYQGRYVPIKKIGESIEEQIRRKTLQLIKYGPEFRKKASLQKPQGYVLRLPGKLRTFRKLGIIPGDDYWARRMKKEYPQISTFTITRGYPVVEMPSFDTLGQVNNSVPDSENVSRGTWGNLQSVLTTVTDVMSAQYKAKIEQAQAETAAMDIVLREERLMPREILGISATKLLLALAGSYGAYKLYNYYY